MTHHPLETLGVADARDKLDSLASRAVHDRQPTVITISEEASAVLISKEEYEELLRLRNEKEIAPLASAIGAVERGESKMLTYTSREELYADFGLNPDDTERT
jgi:PHD/YefM family antitoxin component YafN of YafNO toxin-antitoxin module